MKIVTICGTRPEFIRLIPTIRKLDKYFNHKLLWTGQNYVDNLSYQFFTEFDRTPDIEIYNRSGTRGIDFVGLMLQKLKYFLTEEKPDCVLILGDTYSAFAAAYTAKHMNIPIFHAEAGNRCYDDKRVPEEINRKAIDAIADWHLCYTQRAREQLLLEGKHPSRCIVIGNPIAEIMDEQDIKMNEDKYYLATIHRKENLQNTRYLDILFALDKLDLPVRLSAHPTLMDKVGEMKFQNIEFFTPTNFKEFLQLEANAKCVITDSGTVPEECSILNIPCVLLRYNTERPELLENNSMVMCSNPNELNTCINIAIDTNESLHIAEYHSHVSDNVLKLLMRYNNV